MLITMTQRSVLHIENPIFLRIPFESASCAEVCVRIFIEANVCVHVLKRANSRYIQEVHSRVIYFDRAAMNQRKEVMHLSNL